MEQDTNDLAARLAAVQGDLDYPPGVMAGVFALPALDPVLDAVQVHASRIGDRLPPRLVDELERLAALLLTGMLGTSAESIDRRMRVIELLRRANGGALPATVADEEDAFGAGLKAMLETDPELRDTLGRMYPLASRATSVAPPARWLAEARALVGSASDGERLSAAARRVLVSLVRADVQSRPDVLTGGVRLANQRLARGLLWFAATGDAPAVELLHAVGARMGTSGRSDAVVRDAALANTAAALLGESMDPDATAALASLRLEVTNRNILKQIDRALLARATRSGVAVDDLVDASLPTLGLDRDARLRFESDGVAADIELTAHGRVVVAWHGPDGVTATAPPSIEANAPGAVAEVRSRSRRIAAAAAEERRRLEQRLASVRTWSMAAWRARFGDHPIARGSACQMIWTIEAGSRRRQALPDGEGWVSVDERPLPVHPSDRVSLWHPADATVAEIAAWRATLAARGVQQDVSQAHRQVFAPASGQTRAAGSTQVADTRYGGQLISQPRLRAVLRARGWAVPALGSWDQGDEATAWRAFDSGVRAELRYQAPDRTPSGERVVTGRIIGVRFVLPGAGQPAGAADAVASRLADVPARVFSEALRDVSLALSA